MLAYPEVEVVTLSHLRHHTMRQLRLTQTGEPKGQPRTVVGVRQAVFQNPVHRHRQPVLGTNSILSTRAPLKMRANAQLCD